MSNFSKQYTNYSDVELLKIIEDANNYRPLAVETAKSILKERMLSDEEVETIKAALAKEREEHETKVQKLIELKNKIKNKGASVLDALNPIQNDKPETEKLIAIICVVFSLIFLFHLYTHYRIIRFMFIESESRWDFNSVLFFLPLVMLPSALLLFYFRKRIGLLLLTIFLTYTAVHIFGVYFLTRNYRLSGIQALDTVFPQTPIATQLLMFAFYSGCLYRIGKNDILEMYNVNKKYMLIIIAITILLSSLVANKILG